MVVDVPLTVNHSRTDIQRNSTLARVLFLN